MAKNKPKYDLTGKEFGKLTVVKYVGKSQWLCRCECGNYSKPRTSRLRKGQVETCGCNGGIKDLTGKIFGRLTVLELDHQDEKYNLYWLCKCECGIQKVIQGSALKSCATQSCGCLNIEKSTERLVKHNKKHGYANKERLYEIWKNMKYRCYNKNDNRFEYYGGKGIKVCDEWKDDYLKFRKWAMTNGYNDKLSIDRIDNDGDYKVSNCRWVDSKIQANNQSRNRILTYEGISKTMSEWADDLGLTYGAMNHRVQRGWSMERIVNTPMRTWD